MKAGVVVAWLLLAVVPVALAGAWLAAPAPAVPQPTAYSIGAANATAWAKQMAGAGHTVQALVGGAPLALEQPHLDQVAIVLLAPRTLDGAATAALDRALDAGARVWVADPDGAANGWLGARGLLVDAHRLLDPRHTAGGIALAGPDGTPTSAGPTSSLVTLPGTAWQPLLMADAGVHRDLNGNGSIDRTDPPGPHLVAASLALPGGGLLVVSADASLFTDAAHALPGTSAFLAAAFDRLLPGGGTVLVDESLHGWTAAEAPLANTVHAAGWVAAASPWLRAAALALAVVAGVDAFRRGPAAVPYGPHQTLDPETPPDLPAAQRAERPMRPSRSDPR